MLKIWTYLNYASFHTSSSFFKKQKTLQVVEIQEWKRRSGFWKCQSFSSSFDFVCLHNCLWAHDCCPHLPPSSDLPWFIHPDNQSRFVYTAGKNDPNLISFFLFYQISVLLWSYSAFYFLIWIFFSIWMDFIW